MSVKPRPSRPRHKPRPRSRPRLFLSSPLRLSHGADSASVQAKWSPQQVTLEELLMDYTLPQLVQCKTPLLQANGGRPLSLQLDKPIILAEQRTARHLLARVVQFDGRSRTFKESVDSVVIPEDYDGHFLRLQCRTTKDKSHVQTLEEIASDDTPAFLNLSDITSFPAAREQNDNSYMIYSVGNVFLVDDPLPAEDKKDDSSDLYSTPYSRDTVVSSKSSTRSSKGMMRCLDEWGRAIMVPTKQMGEMVTVQKNGESESKLSVKSSDMIAKEHFPLLARFAYGRTQPRLTDFSKLLTLLDSFQENTLIGCVIDGPSIMLLEFPMTSTLQFQVALNSSDLLQIPRMRHALDACRTRGRDLARDIKYKYKFSHRVQEASRRMMRLKDEDMLHSATVRTRQMVTESYVYI